MNSHDMRDKYAALTAEEKAALPRIENHNGRDYASCPRCKNYNAMMPETGYTTGVVEIFNYCRDCGALGIVLPLGETAEASERADAEGLREQEAARAASLALPASPTLSKYDEAFIRAFVGACGTVDGPRVREFLIADKGTMQGDEMYKLFSDCYTPIMDALGLFQGGVEYGRNNPTEEGEKSPSAPAGWSEVETADEYDERAGLLLRIAERLDLDQSFQYEELSTERLQEIVGDVNAGSTWGKDEPARVERLVYPTRLNRAHPEVKERLEVRSIEGRWFDVLDYEKSLRDYPSFAKKEMDDAGRPCLSNLVTSEPECGCRVVGCGTIQFPLTVQVCSKHHPEVEASDDNAYLRPIVGTVFADPVAFLREERETIECLDNVSSMFLGGPITFDGGVAVVVFDQEEMTEEGTNHGKQLNLEDLVDVLAKLCELVDAGKLFVGCVKSSRDLTDGCNWDAEVTDAFWQLAYHGEVIYG